MEIIKRKRNGNSRCKHCAVLRKKTLLGRFDNRLVTIEEKIGELEFRSVETTQTGEQEEKEVIKNE